MASRPSTLRSSKFRFSWPAPQRSTSNRWSVVHNPSTGKPLARLPLCSTAEINKVVEVAAAALPAWAETPAIERARVMFRFRELMQAKIRRTRGPRHAEHGKTPAEAHAEMQRGIEMVEFACGIPSLLMGQ